MRSYPYRKVLYDSSCVWGEKITPLHKIWRWNIENQQILQGRFWTLRWEIRIVFIRTPVKPGVIHCIFVSNKWHIRHLKKGMTSKQSEKQWFWEIENILLHAWRLWKHSSNPSPLHMMGAYVHIPYIDTPLGNWHKFIHYYSPISGKLTEMYFLPCIFLQIITPPM